MPGNAKGAAKARAARRKKRLKRVSEAGTLEEARRELWRGILYTRDVLRDAEDDVVRLKAVHALQQAVATYTRLVETSELEARLSALEEQFKSGSPLRRAV